MKLIFRSAHCFILPSAMARVSDAVDCALVGDEENKTQNTAVHEGSKAGAGKR